MRPFWGSRRRGGAAAGEEGLVLVAGERQPVTLQEIGLVAERQPNMSCWSSMTPCWPQISHSLYLQKTGNIYVASTKKRTTGGLEVQEPQHRCLAPKVQIYSQLLLSAYEVSKQEAGNGVRIEGGLTSSTCRLKVKPMSLHVSQLVSQ